MATAGYSATPLLKKPGLSPELKIRLLHPPEDYFQWLEADLTENMIRDYALENGLVDIKVCAVSEQWSGLKLVVPLKNR